MKTSHLFGLALALCVQLPASAIEEVRVVKVRGAEYQVTQLLRVKREKINPCNILIGRRGELYHDYKLLGQDEYPLRIYQHDPDFRRVKRELKGTPDYRTFQEAHPNWDMSSKIGANIWGAISTFL